MTAKTATKKKAKQVPFNEDYRPGKGLNADLETYRFILESLDTIVGDIEVWDEKDREKILTREFGNPIEVDLRWGKKWLVACLEVDDRTEFRVCVVLRGDAIKFDVREWYNPDK